MVVEYNTHEYNTSGCKNKQKHNQTHGGKPVEKKVSTLSEALLSKTPYTCAFYPVTVHHEVSYRFPRRLFHRFDRGMKCSLGIFEVAQGARAEKMTDPRRTPGVADIYQSNIFKGEYVETPHKSKLEHSH